jgi:hypothetical protein
MRGASRIEQDGPCRLPLNTPATDVNCGDSRSSPERVSLFLGTVSYECVDAYTYADTSWICLSLS